MSQRPALDATTLAQFTGSETFYRHGLVREIIYTEGARYVAETTGAYWLLDEIVLAQLYEAAVRAEGFQVWDLIVAADGSACLTCGDGNGREIYAKRIEWTDFPVPCVFRRSRPGIPIRSRPLIPI